MRSSFCFSIVFNTIYLTYVCPIHVGNVKAFDSQLHNARPHTGQKEVAARLRSLLSSKTHPSKLFDACESVRKVQDPYTMRCIPQVHGVTIDTIKFAKSNYFI